MNKKELLVLLKKDGHLKTKAVIAAFEKVPREEFVPKDLRRETYANEPLPIGEGQTISQPLTIADMTEALEIKKGQKVLEVGTGSGYQAAIIAEIVGLKGKVYTIERIHSLAERARKILKKLGYKNVQVFEGDGSLGFSRFAPYDRIIVTASSPYVPEPLKEQLKVGGKIIIPVGGFIQKMILLTKTRRGLEERSLGFYAFVPLRGRHGF